MVVLGGRVFGTWLRRTTVRMIDVVRSQDRAQPFAHRSNQWRIWIEQARVFRPVRRREYGHNGGVGVVDWRVRRMGV